LTGFLPVPSQRQKKHLQKPLKTPHLNAHHAAIISQFGSVNPMNHALSGLNDQNVKRPNRGKRNLRVSAVSVNRVKARRDQSVKNGLIALLDLKNKTVPSGQNALPVPSPLHSARRKIRVETSPHSAKITGLYAQTKIVGRLPIAVGLMTTTTI
jgi:hypothetical protein